MDTIKLSVDGVTFYSPGDEDAFFSRLQNIGFIKEINGIDRNLIMHFKREEVSEDALRELISTCVRYGVDLRPLAQFESTEFSCWLRNKNAFWYQGMFSNS